MSDERGSVADRFQALPRPEDDSDWPDVLFRAGLDPGSQHRRGRSRRPLTVGLLLVAALAGATLLGTRLHRAAASPPGPTHIQRQVPNGTVSWLFAHKLRGQSLAQAHIPLLSTTGAHWQPVRFARVITPDPRSPEKIVLSLIGKRGRNICMTVYTGHSASSGGCAVGLLLKPFNYDISSHMNPSCSSCGDVVVAGVASDDVARIELFLPGRHRPVPLRNNVFVVTLGPSVSAWSLAAYDRNGLVIGRSSPPSSIQIPAPSNTPANPPSGLTLLPVISEPGSRGPLSATNENVVTVHAGLHFNVGLRNGSLRRKLTITLTISGARPPRDDHAAAARRRHSPPRQPCRQDPLRPTRTTQGRCHGHRAPRELGTHLSDHLRARLETPKRRTQSGPSTFAGDERNAQIVLPRLKDSARSCIV